uniref:TIR domain-containing protein n=1 Tax=Glossina morsitans morsitans TaxID=37546 RepID=A0A1B0FME2_GLOMM
MYIPDKLFAIILIGNFLIDSYTIANGVHFKNIFHNHLRYNYFKAKNKNKNQPSVANKLKNSTYMPYGKNMNEHANFSTNGKFKMKTIASNFDDNSDGLRSLVSAGGQFKDKSDYICLLEHIKSAQLWWTYSNGTLRVAEPNTSIDISHLNLHTDVRLYAALQNKLTALGHKKEIVIFSGAYNNLTSVPYKTLQTISKHLLYLTISGNNFPLSSLNTRTDDLVAWATFPSLPKLIELDLSHCGIEYILPSVFQNVPNLQKLFMSHNKFFALSFDTFVKIPYLEYLDISFNNYESTRPNLEEILHINYGITIEQYTFTFLPELKYLDLSHTKLAGSSLVAFTQLSGKLKYLSLCYTDLPVIGNELFKSTVLEGLDLSGNTYAANNIMDNAFQGVSDTLLYLFFERSNLKNLRWVERLGKLLILSLAGNNINTISFDTFRSLHDVELLDLSSNHVGNWYSRVFIENVNLKALNLRDNNINIVTTEMLKDFNTLDYLSLGHNNFICDCMLKDIVDIAIANYYNSDCDQFGKRRMEKLSKEIQPRSSEFWIASSKYFSKSEDDSLQIEKRKTARRRFKIHLTAGSKANYAIRPLHLPNIETIAPIYDKLNGTSPRFQLFDYEEEHYWCFNETERRTVITLNCQQSSIVEEITNYLHSLTIYVSISIGTVIVLVLVAILIYFKRWHLFYYYTSLRSATLLSRAFKKRADKFIISAHNCPNMIYDLFISYCQSDRNWILQELLPNIEDTNEISLCLHERDFQIGVTILDNIMSCMDRSRAIMLLISSNFLLSHWCQFEMYLAQHSIFDASKNHLIIVFLEDIPKDKRPKTLQYLMQIKTYIKWPSDGKNTTKLSEERKIFWKRLKRALINIGLNPVESKA